MLRKVIQKVRGRPAARTGRGHSAAGPGIPSFASLFPFEERSPSLVVLFLVVVSLSAGSSFAAVAAPAPAPPPRISWDEFFSRIETTGAEFSEKLRQLEGRRVVLRGYAVLDPKPEGGLYLTHFPESRLHPDDEDTLPWDSVGVVWRKGLALPSVPSRPTVEGTLRLGNRSLGTETVILVLEDAVPRPPERSPGRRAGFSLVPNPPGSAPPPQAAR